MTPVWMQLQHLPLLLEMALTCSSIAWTAKPRMQHYEWSAEFAEHFFRCAQLARAPGVLIHPTLDRHRTNTEGCHAEYLRLLALPLWATLSLCVAGCDNLLRQCQANHKYWCQAEKCHSYGAHAAV